VDGGIVGVGGFWVRWVSLVGRGCVGSFVGWKFVIEIFGKRKWS
jgi:hypothetical protein